MNRLARRALPVACVSLMLAACDSPSTSLALDDLRSDDTDTRYTVGELIQLDVAAKSTDSDATFGTVQVYRSTDDEITLSDTHLGQYPIRDLENGNSARGTVPVATGGWSPGRYVIAVCENRATTAASDDCETLEVDVLASNTLTGMVPGALLVNREYIRPDAEGALTLSIGQALTYDDAATDSYSVAVYLSEALERDASAVQVGFSTLVKGTDTWRLDLDASTWKANTDLYLSACWANGGLANNLTDCYQMAAPVQVLR